MAASGREDEDRRIYRVVKNHEDQYSIWLADRDTPAGWTCVGNEGTKKECLDFIEEIWTDMRPLSLRKAMENATVNSVEDVPDSVGD